MHQRALRGAKSVSEVRARIESLFSDKDDAARVMLTTTHKAKGLERERCWILSETFRPNRGTEEANLWYVAVTRAKNELYLVGATPTVSVPPPEPSNPEPSARTETVSASSEPAPAERPHDYGRPEIPGLTPRAPAAPPTFSAPRKASAVSRAECTPARFLGRCGGCKRPLSALMTAEVRVGTRQYAEGDVACHVYSNGFVYVSCCGRERALKRVRGVYSEKHKCDARCMSSKGTSCECSCGGKNHGAAYA